MKDGFIKVAACSPKIKLGDPKHNADLVIDAIKRAAQEGVTLIAFPELCLTGYTMGDLFQHELLLDCVEKELLRIKREVQKLHIIAIVGAPVRCSGELLNCAAVISPDSSIAFVAKQHLPNYGEFYEARQFTPIKPWTNAAESHGIGEIGTLMPVGSVFAVEDIPNFLFGVEVCEDLWVVEAPSNLISQNGALFIVNSPQAMS